MFENICSLPLSSDLFAQAIHPTLPVLAVGLTSGHVQTYRLPPLSSSPSTPPKKGCGTIETSWRTKRHKGSCRSLAFSSDGEVLYSVGTDGIVKAAKAETGVVEGKIAVPLHNSRPDAPSLIHALSPQTLLLATDSSALHLYDLRSSLTSTPQATHRPHDDYISSLTPLPPTAASTSGHAKQFVTTGGTTLAVTDLRRGVLVKSEDQEEELLSSVYVGKVGKREKVLVGGGSGVLTVWEKGGWEDQEERIIVDKGKESLDCMAVCPEGVGEGKLVAVGLGDGRVRFVQVGQNKIVGDVRHDEMEGVVGVGFEVGGRMISGGGSVVKIWQESPEVEEGGDEDLQAGLKRVREWSDSEDEDESDEESSEEEEKARKKRKKRKQANGKDQRAAKHVIAFNGID